MRTAIVAGCIASRYQYGGGAWVRRSWAEGLRRLGFDVLFLDHLLPDRCVDANGDAATFRECVNVGYFDAVMDEFGFADASVLLFGDGEDSHGLGYDELVARAEAADLLVNISGNLQLEDLKKRIRCKVYIDLDPGWAQVSAAQGNAGARMEGHDLYFTIGENIGTALSPVETGEIRWHHVRQPVLLDDWPATAVPDPMRFTTIATLKGPGPFPRAKINGRMYGLKGDEFAAYHDLPSLTPQTYEVALRHTRHWDAQVEPLTTHGWKVVDASASSAYPTSFRTYVQESGGEFSTARGVYVHTSSGWFSDRTIRYLASGRPALVQETGFSHNLETGEGLVPFSTLDEAVDGARRIAEDYDHHSRAAREVAAAHFSSDVVLRRFLDDVGVSP